MAQRTVSFVFRISAPHPAPFVSTDICGSPTLLWALEGSVRCLSNICSCFFLVSRLRLCLGAQGVHINKRTVLPPPPPPGVATSTVLVGKTKPAFLLNLFSFRPSPFCPSAVFILLTWNTDVRPGAEAVALWPWGSLPYAESAEAERRKAWGLGWPALVYKPLDFLLYKMKKSLLFKVSSLGLSLMCSPKYSFKILRWNPYNHFEVNSLQGNLAHSQCCATPTSV